MKRKTTVQKKSKPQPNPKSKGWRPKGKNIVKDTLHGAPHEIIETTVTPEQARDAAKIVLNRQSENAAEIGKLKQQVIELQEKLSPFKYEFTVNNSLVSVMVRPRAREVIPL